MNHKKILAVLTAAAIGVSIAGCSKTKKNSKQDEPQFDPPFESAFETQAPIASTDTQAVGKVSSIDGTKITVELGELKQSTPKRDSNGSGSSGSKSKDSSRKERSGDKKSRSGDDKKERPSGMFGYTFNATGKTATYDLSGLKEITLENDSDDTADTIDEIKTGDVVVIEVGKDGAATALTVKDLNGRFSRGGGNGKNRDENGKRSDKTGNNTRKNKSSKKDRSDDQDA